MSKPQVKTLAELIAVLHGAEALAAGLPDQSHPLRDLIPVALRLAESAIEAA